VAQPQLLEGTEDNLRTVDNHRVAVTVDNNPLVMVVKHQVVTVDNPLATEVVVEVVDIVVAEEEVVVEVVSVLIFKKDVVPVVKDVVTATQWKVHDHKVVVEVTVVVVDKWVPLVLH
tara:strand:- start:347 stop:697 length:351 start_codon:yes stop_codon:yes gene_type:complete